MPTHLLLGVGGLGNLTRERVTLGYADSGNVVFQLELEWK